MKNILLVLFAVMCFGLVSQAQVKAGAASPCVSGQCKVNLDWVAPATGSAPSWYNVYRTLTSGSCNNNPATAAGCTKVGSTTAPTVTFTDSGLQAATTYFWVVTATNSSGESTPSNEASAATGAAPVPNAPTGLTATPQ